MLNIEPEGEIEDLISTLTAGTTGLSCGDITSLVREITYKSIRANTDVLSAEDAQALLQEDRWQRLKTQQWSAFQL